ncbi:MAG: hypothetical protein CBC42_00325 [Betaproteobacteria bacterium TMED82]|nr:MAG: hypothetical protein CBC42_00325 [Betaproteobacteria bacterium TMED82]|tara:strand:+ start:585 stop:2087 length:1503 start_codon:yes stop_codon:yes gene_type:complete
MLKEILPVLPVIIPLTVAPICVLMRDSFLCWLLVLFSTTAVCLTSLKLILDLQHVPSISYGMGGWEPPIGIEYSIDHLSSIILILLAVFSLIVSFFCRESLMKEVNADKHYIFWTIFLMCLGGLIGVTLTSDAFNAFVFMEISSLASYVLIALSKNRNALLASYRYLILGTIGATMFVLGVGILFAQTGTLNFSDISKELQEIGENKATFAAFSFILVGLSLKAAIFPLHGWLPNAYAHSPSLVATFFAATSTKVALYLYIRFIFDVFGPYKLLEDTILQFFLITLSFLAIIIGSGAAIFQSDLKKIFAYSSIGQIGFITLAITLSTELGLISAILHIINHAITKGLIFLLITYLSLNVGRVTIASIRGLGSRQPLMAFGMVIGCLSLIGVPGTVGFVSKWNLVVAVLDKGYWLMALMVLLTTLLTIIYSWKIIESLYFKDDEHISNSLGNEEKTEANKISLVYIPPVIFLIILTIGFGLDSSIPLTGAVNAINILQVSP